MTNRSTRELECLCEGEFVWACGPECYCWHHAVPVEGAVPTAMQNRWNDAADPATDRSTREPVTEPPKMREAEAEPFEAVHDLTITWLEGRLDVTPSGRRLIDQSEFEWIAMGVPETIAAVRAIEQESAARALAEARERVADVPLPYEGRHDLTVGELNLRSGAVAMHAAVLAVLEEEAGSGD